MCHVLIIEDEPLMALDLEQLLEEAGGTSFSFAASEDEAVAAAAECRPAIITSDVTLAEGTGPGAVLTIRAALGFIPVIYISATAPICSVSDPLTRALPKPLQRQELYAIFNDLRILSGV